MTPANDEEESYAFLRGYGLVTGEQRTGRSMNNSEKPEKKDNILKKLNYDYDRYSKYKNKMFYQELNYKKFINQAMNYLEYELEQEEKQIINELEYDLSEY